MKKALFVILGLLIITSMIATPINAEKKKNNVFYITAGGNTDDGFEFFYWTVGAEMNLFMGNNLMIAPEFMLEGYEFDFDWLWGYAGGTANLLFGRPGDQFFAGGGLLLAFPIEPTWADSELLLKLNGGMISDSIKITLYVLTPFDDIFGYFTIGGMIGFRLF